jgi:hypothetical protein
MRFVAGPSEQPASQHPTQAQAPASSPTKSLQSQTAAQLLTKPLPRFTTFSTSIDTLISHFTPIQSQQRYRTGNGKGKEKEGSIMPGMALEIAGPPGSGKTSIALAVMLSARMSSAPDDGDGGEVLIIGQLVIPGDRSWLTSMKDTEGAFTPERILKAAQASTRNTARMYHFTETYLDLSHQLRVAKSYAQRHTSHADCDSGSNDCSAQYNGRLARTTPKGQPITSKGLWQSLTRICRSTWS